MREDERSRERKGKDGEIEGKRRRERGGDEGHVEKREREVRKDKRRE